MAAGTTGNVAHTNVVSHQAILAAPLVNTSLTANQKTVQDFADVIGVPPVDMGQDYLAKCQRVAALLGLPSVSVPQISQVSTVLEMMPIHVERALPSSPSRTTPYGNVMVPPPPSPGTDANGNIAYRGPALSARNNVFGFINKVAAFTAQASNAGLQPPDNPFIIIANLDAARQIRAQRAGMPGIAIIVEAGLADDLVYNIGAYVELLTAQAQGTLDLDKTTNVSAQLNGFTLSMDGFGSGGNIATDLMRFLPSADEVRAQKDLDLLSAFDFRKRVPKVLFTADYVPTGDQQGMVICWKKIPDASGYVITRRGVFDNTERKIQLSNADLQPAMDHLRDYLKAYFLTFYDTIDDTQVWAYLDQSIAADQYYLYRVQAYQVHNDSKDQIFNVVTNPSTFSSVNQNRLQTTLDGLAKQYFGPSATADDVNPWPLISLQLYGNSQFDWILAAVNSRASVNRNDAADDTRRFSYLGARVSHVIDFMNRGMFVAPKDVNDVVSSVNSSVTNFGVSQTIAEILHETGILYYFEGTEQSKPTGFNRAGTLNVGASPLLSGIIAAVDPETATLDLKSLGTNLPQVLANTQFNNDPAEVTGLKLGQTSVDPNVHASPQEINVPDPSSTTDTLNQGDVDYLNKLPPSDNTIIDLTQYDGLSALVRTIRLFADEGPNRGGGDDVPTGILQPAPPPVAVVAPLPPAVTVYAPNPKVSGIPVNVVRQVGPGVTRATPNTPVSKIDETTVTTTVTSSGRRISPLPIGAGANLKQYV